MGLEHLDSLLKLFDEDPNRAAEQYSQLHEKLAFFFESNGVFERRGEARAEEYADSTLDRAARLIAEGKFERNLYGFVWGIARNILREARRIPLPDSLDSDTMTRPPVAPEPDEERETRLSCCDKCLAKLPTEDRRLALQYFQYQGRDKIAHRETLAAELSTGVPALRIRICRIKKKLAPCINDCLGSARRGVK